MTDPARGCDAAVFIFAICLGFPIAFTLMAMGVLASATSAMGDIDIQSFRQNTYAVMTNDVLIAVPLFLFMGYIVERANILDRLFHALQVAVAATCPASLAVAALATCALFATATGIVGAMVTLMGLLAFPAMLRAGYDMQAVGRSDVRRRHARHPHPAVDHADRLRRDSRRLGGQALRRRILPGFLLAGMYMVYVVAAPGSIRGSPQAATEQSAYPVPEIVWQLGDLVLPARR